MFFVKKKAENFIALFFLIGQHGEKPLKNDIRFLKVEKNEWK